MRIVRLRPGVEAVDGDMSRLAAAGGSAGGAPSDWAPLTSAPVTARDGASFAEGQEAGTRIAACVARLAALELLDGSHWWNRWRHRLMASALVACAEEMESSADASIAPTPSLSTAANRE